MESKERICWSGGAIGADLKWGTVAKRYGYRPIHLSFPGHNTEADPAELRVLSQPELRYGNPLLAKVAKKINRTWPPKRDYYKKLFQRNFWQVKTTRAVYAVGYLLPDGSVDGGTAWAVHAYILQQVPGLLRMWFFDQNSGRWYQWDRDGWVPIGRPPPPTIFDSFTGIGSRKLLPIGERAIEDVFL